MMLAKNPEFLCKDKSCPMLDEDVDIIDSMAFPSSFPKYLFEVGF